VYPKAGPVKCSDINDILQKVGYVTLLKLDCEGSEWPILNGLREWDRVEAICGEYHLNQFAPGDTPQSLAALLQERFPWVTVTPSNDQLGKFWASRVKMFFNNAHTAHHRKASRNATADF
jgi:hypothetical protein